MPCNIASAVGNYQHLRTPARSAPKKDGDNLGFSGHKKVKGDKVVAFCDHHCNVIPAFVAAPGNRNESPLLREALPEVMRISREVGLDLGHRRQPRWRLRLPG
jgi:hypothetical protein